MPLPLPPVPRLEVGAVIQVGDEILTTQDGKAALEFELGGRVKVGHGAAVTVTGERTVSDSKEDTALRLVTSGDKPSHVEIQTNGGVLGGIEGSRSCRSAIYELVTSKGGSDVGTSREVRG